MPLSLQEALAFLVLCVGLALAPGPNLAVVLHSATRGGVRTATASAVGLTASKTVWAIASLVGVAQVLSASAELYALLRVLGGLYLVYLGLAMIWSSRRPRDGLASGRGAHRPQRLRDAARSGAVTDLLNPKVGAFYLAVFPQFIGPADPVILTAALLLLLHAAVLMGYYPLVAWLSVRARDVARRGMTLAPRIVGAGLVASGGALVVSAARR